VHLVLALPPAQLVNASKIQDMAAFALELLDMGRIVTDPAWAPARGVYQENLLHADIRIDTDVAFTELPTGRR
jgi:hypothetical protein